MKNSRKSEHSGDWEMKNSKKLEHSGDWEMKNNRKLEHSGDLEMKNSNTMLLIFYSIFRQIFFQINIY